MNIVQEQIMLVLYKDFKVWQSKHEDMGLDQYCGMDVSDVIKRLPWWAKTLSVISNIAKARPV
jgi:hypothetical protein